MVSLRGSLPFGAAHGPKVMLRKWQRTGLEPCFENGKALLQRSQRCAGELGIKKALPKGRALKKYEVFGLVNVVHCSVYVVVIS